MSKKCQVCGREVPPKKRTLCGDPACAAKAKKRQCDAWVAARKKSQDDLPRLKPLGSGSWEYTHKDGRRGRGRGPWSAIKAALGNEAAWALGKVHEGEGGAVVLTDTGEVIGHLKKDF